MYKNIESLWCSPETSRTLYVNTSIKKLKRKKKVVGMGRSIQIWDKIDVIWYKNECGRQGRRILDNWDSGFSPG